MLNLGGPFIDTECSHRSVMPVYRMGGEYAAAAEELNGRIDYTLRGLCSECFRHSRLYGDSLPASVFLPGGSIDQKTSGGEIGRHRGQLFLHQLKFGERLAELSAFPYMGQRLRKRANRHAAGRRCHCGTEPIECRETKFEALSLGTNPGVSGNSTVFKGNFTERMRRAQLERANKSDTLGLGRNGKAGDATVTSAFVGNRKDGVPVGDAGVGDERLGPIEHVVIAIFGCRRGHG